MNIVVLGGRGVVGRHIVERLSADGHAVRAASRSTGVDIVSGQGLEDALSGADVVVDATNSTTFDTPETWDFFRRGTDNMLEAERRQGISHHVAISVVGTGRIANSVYFDGKHYQDTQLRQSGIPFSIVHATQFYEFLVAIVASADRDQVVEMSPAFIEPVAAADVAALIARVVASGPLNRSVEITGPERERMSDLIRRFVLDVEAPCDVRTVAKAPYFGAILEERTLLPRGDAQRGSTGFEAWRAQSEYARVNW